MPESNRPVIGDFSKPTDPSPAPSAKPAPASASPTAEALSAAETKIDKEARETEASLKPLENYEESLKAIGITRDQAAEIIDNLLFKGYHTEPFTLSPRVKGIFRSRQYTDTERLQNYMEATRPTYTTTMDEIQYRFLLAGSLASFRDQTFSFAKPDSSNEESEKLFQARLSYVRALPDVVVRVLFEKLRKFDEKMAVCLQLGAIENFWVPQEVTPER